MKQIKEQGIGLIDMVVVNLYPFEATIKKENVSLGEAVENIDIGGPSMLRSAAKNYRFVAVVSSPKYYPRLLDELQKNKGCICEAFLKELACEVFRLTSGYDGSIARFFSQKLCCEEKKEELFPDSFTFNFNKVASLRYGENPHQGAAVYQWAQPRGESLLTARQLHGKELSFNNYLDLNAALEIITAFKEPVACVMKHNNPTGVATAATLTAAFNNAWASDPLSAFGSIVGFNRKLDLKTAKALFKSGFVECVLAPGYDAEALVFLKSKKNLRVLDMPLDGKLDSCPCDFKRISGGILVQEADVEDIMPADCRVVTRKKPTEKELISLLFAWKVVKFVKSNAIVLSRGTQTVGIGMGETSRVDSVFMAIKRAKARSRGACMASEAFLPKPDNIALAKKAGIKAIIQPGGSVADQDIIKAADRAKIAMVFTGMRHFKH
jgi:phosphoribosylaminoimidazolecarboxamide formyltransferase/IMP cyclohydrolase